MEHLEITKIVTSVAVAFVTLISRYIFTFLTRDGERMKVRSSSVELIDKVINDREWKRQEKRIVIEEAFEQLFSKPLSFYEIKVLVYSDTPNSAFRTYLKYRPAIELNERKTKFRFRKGKRPYWFILGSKIKLPKEVLKGLFWYVICAFPASFSMTFLTGKFAEKISLNNLVIFWVLDVLVWLLAILFLVKGLKYQDSEKDILKDLGDKFELHTCFD